MNDASKKLGEIIKRQVNVKKVLLKRIKEGREFRGGKLRLDTKLTPQLLAEGFTREVIRRIQSLRKKAGLEKKDKIELLIAGKKLELDKVRIKELVNAARIEISEKYKKLTSEDKFNVREKEIKISFRKVK